jgi:hypothetical protein
MVSGHRTLSELTGYSWSRVCGWPTRSTQAALDFTGASSFVPFERVGIFLR